MEKVGHAPFFAFISAFFLLLSQLFFTTFNLIQIIRVYA